MADDGHVELAAKAQTQKHRAAPSDTPGSEQPPGTTGTASGTPDERQAPATVTHAIPPRCRARTRLYRDGALAAEGFPATEIKQRLAQGHSTIWLDLYDPEIDDLAVLTEEFGLHPLAVEDAVHDHERPKLDRYRDHLLLSAYAADLDTSTGTLSTSELAAFVTPAALITVRKDDRFDVDALIQRWDEEQELARRLGRGHRGLRAPRAGTAHRRRTRRRISPRCAGHPRLARGELPHPGHTQSSRTRALGRLLPARQRGRRRTCLRRLLPPRGHQPTTPAVAIKRSRSNSRPARRVGAAVTLAALVVWGARTGAESLTSGDLRVGTTLTRRYGSSI
jgi:CorA-like Mg2+ transporter protein